MNFSMQLTFNKDEAVAAIVAKVNNDIVLGGIPIDKSVKILPEHVTVKMAGDFDGQEFDGFTVDLAKAIEDSRKK